MASYLITGENEHGKEYRYYETDVYIVDGDYFFLELEEAVECAKARSAYACGDEGELEKISTVEHVDITSDDEICTASTMEDILLAYQMSNHIGKETKILDIVFNSETFSWTEKKVD